MKDGVVRRYTTAVLQALQRHLRREVVLEAVQWLAVDAVQPTQFCPQYLINAATDESPTVGSVDINLSRFYDEVSWASCEQYP